MTHPITPKKSKDLQAADQTIDTLSFCRIPCGIGMTFDLTNDLSGDGMIAIDGVETEAVYYWLTVVPENTEVFAEGSISGPEHLMKLIKKAEVTRLSLLHGPTVRLECAGGKNGVRWVRVFL